MADGSAGSYAINLPNQFEPFGNILQRGIAARNEQNQMLYGNMLRQQQKQEQDDWKKLNLIQDLTDLSKHQTGSDVANAIGNSQMSKIFQKYTANAATLSPAQLQYELNKEVSGVVNAMQGVKNELELGDEQLKLLKQKYPNVDVARLAKDYRADVLGRRLKNDSEFLNPLEVKQSGINFSDPEFLSDYVTGNSSIMKIINDRKGAEKESVLMGKQGDYTTFQGDLNFWQKPSYDRNKFNHEGFYTGREIPSFQLKSSTLPTGTLPSSANQPFEMMDEEVLNRFANDEDAGIEIIAETKRRFPDYKNFNKTEKQYAQRNTLFNILKSNDQSQLHPTSNVRPQVTRVSVNTGESKNPGGDWVKRATAAVQGGNDQTIQDEFAQLFQGDKNGFESVKVENGKVKVTYKTPEKNNLLGQLIPSEPKTVEIDVNDRYLSNKLANVYQTIMGGDVKVERTQYGKTPATRPEAKNKMVTVILKDGRTGQIPEESVTQFLKENPGSKKQ